MPCSATAERDGSHLSYSEIHTGGIWSSEKTRPDRSFLPSGLRNGSFQQVPKTVPSSATAERAGTPVSFLLIRNASVWPSQQRGTDQPSIPRPTAAGSEPLKSMSTNRRAPKFQGKAATRVLTGHAYDSLPPLLRAISKPLVKEHKCYQVELRKPHGRCAANPAPRQHHKHRNAIDAISSSHMGA